MFVLKKSPCLRELLGNHSKRLLKSIYTLMIASFCSLMKNILYLSKNRSKTHRMTDCTHSHQPRRKTSWQNACEHNNSSVTDGSQRITSGWQVWYLLITEWWFVKSINRNAMLLRQFLPAIRQIASELFIFQQVGVPTHWALEAINFPMTLPNLELLQKLPSKQTQQ